jgi:hypothetical protein
LEYGCVLGVESGFSEDVELFVHEARLEKSCWGWKRPEAVIGGRYEEQWHHDFPLEGVSEVVQLLLISRCKPGAAFDIGGDLNGVLEDNQHVEDDGLQLCGELAETMEGSRRGCLPTGNMLCGNLALYLCG